MPQLATGGLAILICPLFTLFVVTLGAAIGRRVLVLANAPREGMPLETAVLATALGLGLLQYVPFALGAFGALGVGSVRLAITAIALLFFVDIRAVARGAARYVATFRADRSLAIWVVVLLPALGAALLSALTPTTDPDGLSYHLTLPKRWLAIGSLAYIPTYPYSNTPMGVEMLFAIALAFAGDVATKVLHFATGIGAAIALYLAGTRLAGRCTGIAAATLCLVGPAALSPLLGFAYVEGATSFMLSASALAWILWFRSRARGWFAASALLAGLAVSFKLTAALFPIALVALTILALQQTSKEDQGPLLRRALALAPMSALIAAPVLPWLARAFVLTGNPVFPLFAGRIPTRDYTPEHAAQFDKYNRYMVWAGNHTSWTLEKRQHILELVALMFCVMGVIAYTRMRSRLGRGTVVVCVAVALAQVLSVGLYVRYWIPILCVLQVPLLAWLEPVLAGGGGRINALIAVSAIASLFQARAAVRNIGNDVGGAVKTTLGMEAPRDYLVRHAILFPLYERANRDLGPNAGVVLSNYCGGFYVDRTTYCAEFVQDSLRFEHFEDFVADAKRLGITHVIAPRTLATGGPPPPVGGGNTSVIIRPFEFATLARLLNGHSRLLESAADQGLYEIEWDSVPSR
jgi:hypothetical protein